MDPLTAPIEGADSRSLAGVQIDTVPLGEARLKRAIYPAGFRWSRDMKPHVSTDLCMHAHVGFLAQGAIAGEYEDGCTFAYAAPAAFVIDAGHDAWVEGDADAVLIQFDAAENTVEFLGLTGHSH
jgi:hypothetical protein